MATKKVKKMAFGGFNRMAKPMANSTSASALTVDPGMRKNAVYPTGNMGSGFDSLKKFGAANKIGATNSTAQTSPTGSMGNKIGTSPLDGAKNLPKMTGSLGVAGTKTLNSGKNFSDVSAMSSALKGLRGSAMKKGGSVSSASKRADGCATKGKTKGTMR